MGQADFAVVIAYIESAIGKPISFQMTRVYYDLLGDLPLEALQIAAKRCLLENDYPTIPTVAVLRKAALDAQKGQRLLPAEAWELCRRAIARFGYMREEAGLASLPADVRRAADVLGWQSLCESDNPEVCRAQFQRAYESLAERQRRVDLLPPAVREAVGQLARQFAPPALLEARGATG